MKKLVSMCLAFAMACVSVSMVSWDAASEEVTGPFAVRNTGYPTYLVEQDQVQDVMASSRLVSSNDWVYQTFKPGVMGELTSVSIFLEDVGGDGNVHVDIYQTDGSGNLQTPLATANFATFSFGWVDVAFMPGPNLFHGME